MRRGRRRWWNDAIGVGVWMWEMVEGEGRTMFLELDGAAAPMTSVRDLG